MTIKEIRPQAGYQERFARCSTDIAIGGAAAGVGKSFSLLMEPVRWISDPAFGAVFFRRTIPEITQQDGLWDEAKKLYGATTGGRPIENRLTWRFPNPDRPKFDGARVKFSHLQHEKDKLKHKGGQYPLVCFDELTSFTESQFWYLLSRNRTTLDVSPYIRATTNPETTGWVKNLVSWWLYPDDYDDDSLAGYPIAERDGVPRFFFRDGDVFYWGNSKLEVIEKAEGAIPEGDVEWQKHLIKSLTFIGGSIYDNKKLLSKDPGYLGNLFSLDQYQRDMLLKGCWRYRPGQDDLFNLLSLHDIFSNDFVPAGRSVMDRYITADIALEGSDLFVIGVWDGWRLIYVHVLEKSPGPAVVHVIADLARRFRVPGQNIAYDRDGVGGFLGGYFPQSVGVNNGGSVIVDPRNPQEIPNFENLRAQLFYMLAEWIGAARIYAALPADQGWIRDRIIKELAAHKKRDSDKVGKLKISRKEEVKSRMSPRKSPDFADMVAMRMVFFLLNRVPSTSSTG